MNTPLPKNHIRFTDIDGQDFTAPVKVVSLILIRLNKNDQFPDMDSIDQHAFVIANAIFNGCFIWHNYKTW